MRKLILLLCLILFYPATEASEDRKPTPVKVMTPQLGTMKRDIVYTGTLEADATVEIYANVPGKLVVLNVDDGERVQPGAVLAQTDNRELLLALKQAEAALKAAEAHLLTVKATAQIKVEGQAESARAALDSAQAQLDRAKVLAKVQVTSQWEQAEATVTAAEAALKKAGDGAREQERKQAEATVKGASASLEHAKANLERAQHLHENNALSDQDWDTAKKLLASATTQHEVAVEQLSLVQAGARQEDIRAAEAQLKTASAALALARITVETKDWNTQIKMAQSTVRTAQVNLQSAQQLVNIRAWDHEIAAAEAQFNQANATVNLAKKRLADATITAPIDGIVVSRSADLGDYASGASGPGAKPILTLIKADVVKAVFTVSEADLSTVAVGQSVTLSMEQQQIEGHIRFISPLVNPEDRMVRVKAAIPNPEYRLKPGMFVEVKVDRSAADKSLLLPRSAVLDIQDGQGHVFVKTGDTAKKQTVRVGHAWGENISILSGVSDTTPVLISGHRQLTDGDAIVVVE